ncbi:MAG: TM0106 family RecB-like putative nuclease [Chloracidobacterium sp.]|nr:TM0106 family RecB-like putative nuclease [Chloracidobacterium sp.]
MKKFSERLIYSPTDIVRFLESPFASWMDRHHIENPGVLAPKAISEDARLIIETGQAHERKILEQLRGSEGLLYEVEYGDQLGVTLEAIRRRDPIIYQAKLANEFFEGYADFMILDEATGRYQIWDAKLAHSPKPYYAVQLCAYSELYAEMTGEPLPEKFGLILGADAHGISERIEMRSEDFIHYYRNLKERFLEMQGAYDADLDQCPIPDPGADHYEWQEYADAYLDERDHLIRVAGITAGQIKKLAEVGICTLTALAETAISNVSKLPSASLEKLKHQARLQNETRKLRTIDKNAAALFDILPTVDENGRPVGLAALPEEDPYDVFFDMEGYPLIPGGLEYLFGNTIIDPVTGEYQFIDFWAHDREGEKEAFEQFIDWVFDRWQKHPLMHIYHYAAYEVAAVRRLSTFHDTRQEEVDQLLKREVFCDLYKIVRQGVRIGEQGYSIKKVEGIYWPQGRTGVVTLSIGSVVHYARWIGSGEPRDWQNSPILKEIRDYNKDDCDSTAMLAKWLRGLAAEKGIPPVRAAAADLSPNELEIKPLDPVIQARLEIGERLREKADDISLTLADLIDFHRREQKPVWWKFFERCGSDADVLRDDSECIADVEAEGEPYPEKKSLAQRYRFDPTQECKLHAAKETTIFFSHANKVEFTLISLDLDSGTLELKITADKLAALGGEFPQRGSLVPLEYVRQKPIQEALTAVAASHLNGNLNAAANSLLTRKVPPGLPQKQGETTVDLAIRVARQMDGDCLVIQGPPGTGKTYTASHMIAALLADGKRIGITSNSHKAIINLLDACGRTLKEQGRSLAGFKVGGNKDDAVFRDNPDLLCEDKPAEAVKNYHEGVLAGTAWLFSRDDFPEPVDHLFIDEAGQVPLANVIAMSGNAKNLVLLGDQMQLEQPIQGSHPGDARLSALQYALKDIENSREDDVVLHAVVRDDYGIFLGESRRMHPAVCQFISESVYEGRLHAFEDCARQAIASADTADGGWRQNGIVFLGVEHDGDIQSSDEEAEKITEIYEHLRGRLYTDKAGTTVPIELSDFLFIAPYNAQVRKLEQMLPHGARIGSVDLFQGQEAPVCILSLCSSFGEYGSRGINFILNKNRVNVAVSRAKCLAVVVADPRIATTPPNSIETMQLLNLFCKLLPFQHMPA